MADQGADERTETATAKRRGEARKRGQVPKSMELSAMTVLTGLLLALHGLLTSSADLLRSFLQNSLIHLDDTRLSNKLLIQHGGQCLMALGKAVGPLVLTAMCIGILVNMAQTGPLWAIQRLQPDFNRINPLSGLKGFLSPRSLVELVKSFYKIGLIGYLSYITIRGSYMDLMGTARLGVADGVSLVGATAYRLALRVVSTMLVLAALDYFFQRWQYEKSIRMTKDEVRREMKDQQVSPHIRSRIRARQRDIARKRMMADVPSADVVITNPTHFAIALRYDARKMAAPILVAKGQDLIALRIRELAQKHDIPIVENPPLARALFKQVEIGREIPGELYEAVAEVLAFVYQVNQKRRERMGLSAFAR